VGVKNWYYKYMNVVGLHTFLNIFFELQKVQIGFEYSRDKYIQQKPDCSESINF